MNNQDWWWCIRSKFQAADYVARRQTTRQTVSSSQAVDGLPEVEQKLFPSRLSDLASYRLDSSHNECWFCFSRLLLTSAQDKTSRLSKLMQRWNSLPPSCTFQFPRPALWCLVSKEESELLGLKGQIGYPYVKWVAVIRDLHEDPAEAPGIWLQGCCEWRAGER